MHYLVLAVIAFIGATIQSLVRKSKKKSTANNVLRTFLIWFLILNVGVASLLGFMGHAFMPDQAALFIGWMPGSPFQFEIAIVNLMMCVLGIMCFWFEDGFWMATIVATTVFGWGAAYGHVREMIVNHNYAPGNAGPPLYADIIGPIVLIILFTAYKATKKKK